MMELEVKYAYADGREAVDTIVTCSSIYDIKREISTDYASYGRTIIAWGLPKPHAVNYLVINTRKLS